jgi:hypothetical protein
LAQSSILRFDAVTGFWPIGGGGGRTFLYRQKKALGPARYACCFGPGSAIGVWLLLDFGRQLNKSSDCFSTRWEVGLASAPIVYRPQKLLRYPHLKRAILRAFRWAPTGPAAASHFCTFCIDTSTSKVYVQCRPMASCELATGPNPSHGGTHGPG